MAKETKEKNPDSKYRQLRAAMGWSREYAAEQLGMSDDKLERIENGRQTPNPQDVMIMSNVYRAPGLCNFFCHNACEIGRQYVPEVPDRELPEIILRLLNSLYEAEDLHELLIRITADGIIDDDEIEYMVDVQSTLEKLSIMIESLQICIEKKVDNEEISKDLYEEACQEHGLFHHAPQQK